MIHRSRKLALLPDDPAIKKLLAICSATSSRIRNALSKTSGTSLPEGLLAQLPHPLHPHQIFGVQWLMTLYQQGQNGVRIILLSDHRFLQMKWD